MPENKEPGQVAYESDYRFGSLPQTWGQSSPETRAVYANLEAAVLAAHKPERAAGVWITDHNNLQAQTFFHPATKTFVVIARESSTSLCRISSMIGDFVCDKADARKVVEALGGTWPEEQANG
nr:hypothetical protein [uncultured Rhodopila sp.]